MKKIIKRNSKKLLSLVLLLAMVLSYFLPIAEVFAEGGYVITFTSNNNHEMVIDNGTLRIDGQYVELRNNSNEKIGVSACNNGTCTITVDSDVSGSLNYNDAKKFTLYMQGHPFDGSHVFAANENIAVQDYEDNIPGPGTGNDHHFDGNAYLIWSCESGGICYHHFDNIPNFDDGNSTFYKASDIKDARTNESFKVEANYKGWATDERFNNWVKIYKAFKNIEGDINWAEVNPEDMLGLPLDMREYENQAIQAGACTRENTPQDEFQNCVDEYVVSTGVWASRVQLQPVGEPEANNAYVSYGDRNFKVVVYNDDYKGIAMGDFAKLNYYPAHWSNPFVRRDQFDISGTTKDKPALMDSILLEKTVVIKTLDYNNFEIASIEALDVPENAVNITKDNGEFSIEFSSNFYDNVTFKITDKNGEISYLQIKRYTVDSWIKFVDNHPVLTADFFFDEEKEYTDFDITAKIIYKDGTSKNVTLEATRGIDDGLGNITDEYEVFESEYGGKGLKKASFNYNLADGEDREIKKVYLNVEFKGSTETTYAGAYVGSGEGVLANIYMGDED